ncbi:hypothetical protein [Streptomyces sp. NPDC056682]|uniref:hypothetical protein n=1 Tax=Streptomyces sp. NPDC056682 TaxID=3345909 RepID=UPI00368F3C13
MANRERAGPVRRPWVRDGFIAVIDLVVASGVLAAGLVVHACWVGALAGLWLVLALGQGALALRAGRPR